MNIFGYYDRHRQSEPTYDPPHDAPCPVCLLPVAPPVRTVSLMAEHNPQRSYFYRLHKRCHETASALTISQIESSVIEAEAQGTANGGA